ncbi:2-hydroxyacid dehydrogenase [Chitinimonas naiadis]
MTSNHPPCFYLHTPRDAELWRTLFQAALPEYQVCTEIDDVQATTLQYMAAWQPAEGVFSRFPALKAVFALGAGVDRFLNRTDLAPAVDLIRLTDAGMARQMTEYVLAGVLRYQRDFDLYAAQQAQACWLPQPGRAAEALRIGVLGLGEMGAAVAATLAQLGYCVTGWSRSERSVSGVHCVHGWDALEGLLAGIDVLVNILPNTPETHGLLSAKRLARLPAGAALINAGRGEQLDEQALLALLDSGHLRGAQLDVLNREPAQPDHPFWRHPKVVLTPHIAAKTLPGPSVQQIADKLRDVIAGRPVAGLVDRRRAY